MMNKVAAAQEERENSEINLLNSGPIARAQVERVAALKARIEELEALLESRVPVRTCMTLHLCYTVFVMSRIICV